MVSRVFHVEGNPDAIASRAATLRERGQKVRAVADQMRVLGPGVWEGPAAQAFTERFTLEPDRWEEMGQAFIDGADALTAYAGALRVARDHASECQRRYNDVETMRAHHRAHPQASTHDQPYAWNESPSISDLTGPDFTGMHAAIEADWQNALADLRASCTQCANALKAACANAPQQRSWFDILTAFPRGQYEAGIDIALTGLHTLITPATLAWQVNTGKITPNAAWKVLTAPLTHMHDLGHALINAPIHTTSTIAWQALDIEGLADDAPRSLGKHATNIGLSLLGGGTLLKTSKTLQNLIRHTHHADPPTFIKNPHPHPPTLVKHPHPHLPSNKLDLHPTLHTPHPTGSHTPEPSPTPSPDNTPHPQTPHPTPAPAPAEVKPFADLEHRLNTHTPTTNEPAPTHSPINHDHILQRLNPDHHTPTPDPAPTPPPDITRNHHLPTDLEPDPTPTTHTNTNPNHPAEHATTTNEPTPTDSTHPTNTPPNTPTPTATPLNDAEPATAYDPHSTQLSTLPTLKSEEEIAALTRPTGISDKHYETLRLERTQAPTGIDHLARTIPIVGDNSVAPPHDGSSLDHGTLALVKDVGEVLGRDQHGNLLSYNQWWDGTIGQNRIWPVDGEKLPAEVRLPEGAKHAPGVEEPAQYTVWGGAFKETVIDWGGDKARALAKGIVHMEGSRDDLLAAFRAHYELPSKGAIYLDRVGEPNGGFLGLIGPDGPASFGERSLNPSSLHNTYYAYQLIEDNIPDDYTIRSGITAPYHGGQGGATQLQIFNRHGDEVKVERLIIDGVLRKVI